MSSAQSSLARAVEDEADTPIGFGGLATAEQLDLLRDSDGALPKDALQRVRLVKRGRPPNARNKRTKKFAQYLLQKWGDPADVLGEIMTMPLDVMAEQWRLAQGGENKSKPIRAEQLMRIKLQATMELMPYVHGKQPLSVEVTNKDDMVIVIPGLIPGGHSQEELTTLIDQHGVGIIDPDTLEIVIEDAEFDEVEDDEDGGDD